MIKQYKILIISFLGILHCNAQTSYSLEVNNIKAKVNSNIHLFNDNDAQIGGFESKLNNYTSTIFSSSLWLGAEHPTGQLAIAAEKYYDSTATDYQTGPVGSSHALGYDRVFPITQNDIDQHLAWYNCVQDPNCDVSSTFPNYSIPQYILEWPAHGDLSNNEAFYLAPFVDVNNDGIYNPSQGDYPLIKGDEAVFYILNDAKGIHTSSGGEDLGAEIHVMVYSYASNTEAISNTIFVNYKIYNRSTINYSNLKIGVFTDLDMVCSGNDLIGCDTLRNMYYGYNSIADDSLASNVGQVSCFPSSYGAPAQGVKFLNKTMSNFSYYGGYGSSSMSDPANGATEQFYNYLSSKWRDGSSLYYGGNGYFGNSGVSNTETNYAFPSNPSQLGGWKQEDIEDIRGVGVTTAPNFDIGDVICFDMAYIFNLDKNVDNLENVNQLLLASDEVQSFYDNNELGCDYLLTSIDDEEQIKQIKTIVYPNPFSESTKIEFNNTISKGKFSLYNSLGQNVGIYELLNQNGLRLERANLESGIYFFSVEENGIVLSNGKLIIE